MIRNGITLKDVAAKAGVSVGTAYNALSGKSRVSAAAHAKVLAAAAELNYKASEFGRRLRTGKSRNLALISSVPSAMSSWFVMDMLNAAIEEAAQHGYTLSLVRPNNKPEQPMELLGNGSADGIILMQIRQRDRRVELLQKNKAPFVAMGRTNDPAQLNWVDFNTEAAIYKAFEYLAHLGHQKIGFIAPQELGPQHDLGMVLHLQRGYQRAVRDFELEIVSHPSGASLNDGYAAAEQLLETHPDLTALFASYGSTHYGALQALHKRGLRVPQDMSVITITGEVSAIYAIPRLTSVDIPQLEMSRAAVRQLIHRLEGEPVFEQSLLTPNLVIRDSTAPPKKRR